MQETLFNPPVWLPVLIAIVGVAVFVYGNARVQSRVRNAGVGVIALVAAWAATAYFVMTPVER